MQGVSVGFMFEKFTYLSYGNGMLDQVEVGETGVKRPFNQYRTHKDKLIHVLALR